MGTSSQQTFLRKLHSSVFVQPSFCIPGRRGHCYCCFSIPNSCRYYITLSSRVRKQFATSYSLIKKNFFLSMSLSGFGIRVMVALQNEFESVPLSLIFFEIFFEKDRYKFLFICLVEFPNEAIWSWSLVCREFYYFRFYLF